MVWMHWIGAQLALAAAACDPLALGFGPHSQRFNVGFANDTNNVYDDVQAQWPFYGRPYRSTAGYLGPGAEAMNHGEVGPIPTKATVSWRTPDGEKHEQQVLVASKIKDVTSFTGSIWFKFTDKGVELVPRRGE